MAPKPLRRTPVSGAIRARVIDIVCRVGIVRAAILLHVSQDRIRELRDPGSVIPHLSIAPLTAKLDAAELELATVASESTHA